MTHQSNTKTDEEIIDAFNSFIEKWCGNSFAHLIDSDDNDGERFREKLRKHDSQVRKESLAQGQRDADDLLDDMWGLICNVNGGIVENEKPEWYGAFKRIRAKYFNHLDTLSPSKEGNGK